MKRIAADVWVPRGDAYEDRMQATRDDIRGLAIAKVLERLSAEVKAYRAKIRHQLRRARGLR